MKQILFTIAIGLAAFSCKKDCTGSNDSRCKESPETNGVVCTAYFESWIYDPNTQSCAYRGYSGCGPIGFETKTECEQCACND